MKHWVLIFSILLLPLCLNAQEDGDSENAPVEEQDLQERYRPRELETATLEELRYLAEQAGLNVQGSRDNLEARLKEFYGLNPQRENPEINPGNQDSEEVDSGTESDAVDNTNSEKEEQGLQITIESADSTRSVEVEEKGGQEIILSGRVVLNILQAGQGVTHRIYADRVIFSRITDQVSALGNILYIRLEGEKEETFTGDSLTFIMKGWKGIIYNGLSQREDEQEEEGEIITFFFRGEEFISSGNERFIMKRGAITSGDPENPTYRIQAKKIWILAPQEWGLSHGVLYIGRVPLLYVPFYYRPGNEMLFNPVMGYRNREGALIQTTTYLLGRKDSESSSFFNAGLVTDESYTLERQGLFLNKGDKLEGPLSEDYIKLMADYYTRLGTYAGLAGRLSGEELSSSFRLGLAFSRSIDSNNSIYFDDGSGGWEERPDSSYFFGVDLPFRWEGSLEMNWTYLDIELGYLSDGQFSGDFHNRRETFDWLNWLLEERDSELDLSEETPGSIENRISYHRSLDVSSLSPGLKTWTINDVSLKLLLQKGTDESLEASSPEAPGVYYYYPRSLQSRLQMTLGGQVFQWESGKEQEETPAGADTAESDVNEEPSDSEAPEDIRELGPFPDFPELEDVSTENSLPFEPKNSLEGPEIQPDTLNIRWSLIPRSSLELPYLYENWSSQTDVDGSLDFSKWITELTGTVNYEYSTLQKILVLKGVNRISGRQMDYMELYTSMDDLSEARKEEQKEYDQWNWTNDMTLTLYPLIDFPDWKSSSLAYNFDNRIYQWQWDQTEDQRLQQWFSFQDEMIETNKSTVALVFSPSEHLKGETSYGLEYYPDRSRNQQDWSAGVTLKWGPFSQSFRQSATWTPDEWVPGNLESQSIISFYEGDLSLTDKLFIDMEEKRLYKDQWTLNVWDFQAAAQAQYSLVYQWNDVDYTWDPQEDRYHWESLNLRYNPNGELPPVWKNRITQDIDMDLLWSMNFNKLSENTLKLDLSYNLGIFQFVDLSLGVNSRNDSMYLYFKPIREVLGIEGNYNFFQDLVRSFGFFSPGQQMRYDSFFNMTDFTLEALHYMGNWTALLDYSGYPEVEEGNTLWKSSFSFIVQWSPIPSIKSRFEKDEDDEWSALTDW